MLIIYILSFLFPQIESSSIFWKEERLTTRDFILRSQLPDSNKIIPGYINAFAEIEYECSADSIYFSIYAYIDKYTSILDDNRLEENLLAAQTKIDIEEYHARLIRKKVASKKRMPIEEAINLQKRIYDPKIGSLIIDSLSQFEGEMYTSGDRTKLQSFDNRILKKIDSLDKYSSLFVSTKISK